METERQTIDVPDRDTTYRVKSGRVEDLKARALAMFFAPHEVKFKPQQVTKDGTKALALAYIDARAVQQRLDKVLGPWNWQTSYKEVGKDSVECTLAVRFTDGGEWITKVDVGSTSEQPDEGDRMKAAYSDALKRAAVHFGVGRYLYHLPRQWVDYDSAKKRFAVDPTIPANFLPSDYLPAGLEKMRKVVGLMESALKEIGVPRDQWRRAAVNLVADYGYKSDYPAVMHEVQGRHAAVMTERMHEWIRAIANGVTDSPLSPLPRTEAKPEAPKVEAPKPEAAKPEPKPKTQVAAEHKTEPPKPLTKSKPSDGADMLARLTLRDAELAKYGRMQKDALKAHVLACGVHKGYSADMTRWQGNQIAQALEWAAEFIADLPAPGTVKQLESDAPRTVVA